MDEYSFYASCLDTLQDLFQLSWEDCLTLLLLIMHAAFLSILFAFFLTYHFAIKSRENQAENIIMALHDRKGWIYLHGRQGSPLDGTLLYPIQIESDLSTLLEELIASNKTEENEK